MTFRALDRDKFVSFPATEHRPEAQDAEAEAEALVGMGLGTHDRFTQRDSGRADLLGGGEQARTGPRGIAAVGARHMFGNRRVAMLHRRVDMAGDPHAALKCLDDPLCDPHLDDLADQS